MHRQRHTGSPYRMRRWLIDGIMLRTICYERIDKLRKHFGFHATDEMELSFACGVGTENGRVSFVAVAAFLHENESTKNITIISILFPFHETVHLTVSFDNLTSSRTSRMQNRRIPESSFLPRWTRSLENSYTQIIHVYRSTAILSTCQISYLRTRQK